MPTLSRRAVDRHPRRLAASSSARRDIEARWALYDNSSMSPPDRQYPTAPGVPRKLNKFWHHGPRPAGRQTCRQWWCDPCRIADLSRVSRPRRRRLGRGLERIVVPPIVSPKSPSQSEARRFNQWPRGAEARPRDRYGCWLGGGSGPRQVEPRPHLVERRALTCPRDQPRLATPSKCPPKVSDLKVPHRPSIVHRVPGTGDGPLQRLRLGVKRPGTPPFHIYAPAGLLLLGVGADGTLGPRYFQCSIAAHGALALAWFRRQGPGECP
jgi:hypothetical protein